MDNPTLAALVIIAAVVMLIGLLLSRRRREAKVSVSEPNRLARTADALGAALRKAWGSGIDKSTWGEIEEALLAADVGVEATTHIVDGVRSTKPETADEARAALSSQLRGELGNGERTLVTRSQPSVWLVVGVNGTGKTTTVAKLAKRLKDEGKTVILGATDTYRAAAREQLQTWGDRVEVEVVGGQVGGDPASVAFDTLASARAKGIDVVIIDTAGRLHGKKNLMAELGKIHRVAAGDGSVDEVLLVLDATTGQNGVVQVREFAETVPVTGIILTKLDGTARGGIIIAVEKDLGVPVKLIGVGEGLDDLVVFDPDIFVDALLEES
ncbi:MAG: signal recognition particle-docking protein FtsY [Acidobacteria bacterium]|nr:signal recognition particle-docking protein FtsY [Acidobacteriota bacterium]